MLAVLERWRWQGRHTGQVDLALTTQAVVPEPSLQERAAWERQVLGTPVGVHPLELVAEALSSHDIISSDALTALHGQEVLVAGVRLSARRFRTGAREAMLLVDMEDQAGIYQVLWRGTALKKHRVALSRREPVLIRGWVQTDRQGLTVIVGREVRQIGG